MTVSWGTKDPNEVRSYAYSWLGRLNGAEIVTASLVVSCGTVTLSNIANTLTGISATVSGGIDCEDAVLTSTITTTDSQTLEESFSLAIRSSAYASMGPSTSTKRQIIEMAYEECSLAGYEFNLAPEELFSGLRKLDALMAEWRISSKDLNYNAPTVFGGGDLEDVSGIPDAAIQGVAITLAEAIMPAMGKVMSPETRARKARSMDTIRAMCAVIPNSSYPVGTPIGAGNRRFEGWGPFFPTPSARCR